MKVIKKDIVSLHVNKIILYLFILFSFSSDITIIPNVSHRRTLAYPSIYEGESIRGAPWAVNLLE